MDDTLDMGRKSRGKGGSKEAKGTAVVGCATFPSSVTDTTLALCSEIMKLTTVPSDQVSNLMSHFEAIEALRNELVHVQKNYRLPPLGTGDPTVRLSRLQRLFAWLAERGDGDSVVCGVEPACCGAGEGFGLRATRDISAHDILLRIPNSVFMSHQTALASSYGGFLRSDNLCSHMDNVSLALHLLAERALGDASPHHTYISTLPETFDTVGYLTAADFALVKRSPHTRTILKNYMAVCRAYAYLFAAVRSNEADAKLLPFRDTFCFEDYCWAVAAVQSRNNSVPVAKPASPPPPSPADHHTTESGRPTTPRPPSTQLCLIPAWDLANHRLLKFSTDYEASGHIVFYAPEDTSFGDQVCIFYGPRTNAEFFMFSGFVPPQNPSDRLPVYLGFSSSDPLRGLRLRCLASCHVNSEELCLFRPTSDGCDGDTPASSCVRSALRCFSRVFVADASDLGGAANDETGQGVAVTTESTGDKTSTTTGSALTREQLLAPFHCRPAAAGDARDAAADATEDASLDARALRFLQTRLRLLLAAYGDGQSGDHGDLDSQLQSTRANCLNLIESERNLLRAALHELDACMSPGLV